MGGSLQNSIRGEVGGWVRGSLQTPIRNLKPHHTTQHYTTLHSTTLHRTALYHKTLTWPPPHHISLVVPQLPAHQLPPPSPYIPDSPPAACPPAAETGPVPGVWWRHPTATALPHPTPETAAAAAAAAAAVSRRPYTHAHARGGAHMISHKEVTCSHTEVTHIIWHKGGPAPASPPPIGPAPGRRP